MILSLTLSFVFSNFFSFVTESINSILAGTLLPLPSSTSDVKSSFSVVMFVCSPEILTAITRPVMLAKSNPIEELLKFDRSGAVKYIPANRAKITIVKIRGVFTLLKPLLLPMNTCLFKRLSYLLLLFIFGQLSAIPHGLSRSV